MEVTFVSTNKGKYEEIKDILESRGVGVKWVRKELPEKKSMDLRQVAAGKALAAFEYLRKPVVAEDTGLFIKEFNGFPGAFSKTVARGLGVKGLLRLIGKGLEAEFGSVAAYCDGTVKLFEGNCPGKLVPRRVSERVFEKNPLPYDFFFVPKGERKTWAEAGSKKESYSHREQAFEKLADWLSRK